MVELAKRLEEAMAHAQTGVAELARATKVSYQGIRKVLDGRTTSMQMETAQKIAKFCGVKSLWLAAGEGPKFPEEIVHVGFSEYIDLANDEPGDEPRSSKALYLPGFEPLHIPVLAQAGSMGLGEEQMHDEVVIGRLTVSPQWVTRTIKPLTKIENLRFIHGYGDSMEPTFADGDILLVDAGVIEPKVDGVYVLEANDRIYIKRVRQKLNGAFEVSSDNPTVKTVDALDGSHDVNVRGRVVFAWNGKRL